MRKWSVVREDSLTAICIKANFAEVTPNGDLVFKFLGDVLAMTVSSGNWINCEIVNE